jgi:hypothetical protein
MTQRAANEEKRNFTSYKRVMWEGSLAGGVFSGRVFFFEAGEQVQLGWFTVPFSWVSDSGKH